MSKAAWRGRHHPQSSRKANLGGESVSKKNLRVTYYNEEQGRVYTLIELGHRVLSYEELKILLEKTPAKGILVDKIAWVDSEQNMLSKLDFADTQSREKKSYE